MHHNDLERLHYLKACLDGEAATLVHNIPITGENFNVAWRKLESRYANKRDLINAHLNNLFTVKTVPSASPTYLRRLIDQVTDVIDALKVAGRPTDYWDDLLVYMITRKLDRDTREAWELEAADSVEPPTFDELSAFLGKRIRAFESAGSTTEKTRVLTKSAASVQAHLADTSSSRCVMCPENHAIYKCKRFTLLSVPRRWETAKKFKLCFNCLTNFHSGKACGSTRKCMLCNKEHHTLLHNKSSLRSIAPSSVAQSEARALPTARSATETPSTTDTVVNTHHTTKGAHSNVLLATTRVRVGSSCSRVVCARALLDPGSTHSFVSSALVRVLHARTLPVSARVIVIGGKAMGRVKSTRSYRADFVGAD